MKNKNTLLLSFAVLITVLISCTKELSYESPGSNSFTGSVSQISSDSGKLKRMFYVDTTATTNDTSEINTFIYDNAGRVKMMLTANNGIYDTSGFFKYDYHNSDTVPYRAVSVDLLNPADSIEIFYMFDAQHRRLKDSIYNHKPIPANERIQLNIYSYYTGGFVLNYFDQNAVGFPMENTYRDSVTLDAAGNMILYKEYDGGPLAFDLVQTVAMTYDNKINPLSRLSTFKIRDMLVGGEPLYIESIGQINNVTKYTYNFRQPFYFPDFSRIVNFSYLQNNLPFKAVEYNSPSTGNGSKVTFQYY